MASRVMRAIRVSQFGGPEMMKLVTDVPIPTPKEKEVLIKVFTVGVNPVDTYILTGTYAARVPSLPYTPGTDCAGVVESVGNAVTKFQKGDRVFSTSPGSGTYAEYAVTNEMRTFPLHDNLNFSQGAALGLPYFTAYRAAITRARGRPGEIMLVHGASGGVGLAACQIGNAHGMRVIGTAGTEDGIKNVLDAGAEASFNHREKGYTDKIMAHTGGQGVDVIIEMLANENLDKDLALLKKNGRVIILGCRGPININPRMTMGKESEVRGCALALSTDEDWYEMGAAVCRGIEKGWARPVVGFEYPLGEVAEAHKEVIAHKKGTKGKIILSI